jgi:hypothetical protein
MMTGGSRRVGMSPRQEAGGPRGGRRRGRTLGMVTVICLGSFLPATFIQTVMPAMLERESERKGTVTVGQSRSQSRIHSRVCTGLCCVPTVSLHFRVPTTRPVATFHQRHPIHTRHSMRILTKNSQFSEPTYSSYQTLHPGGATHYEFLASNVSLCLTLPLSCLLFDPNL